MRALGAVVLLAPAAVLAGSGFDGTWKARPDSFRFSGEPDVYLLVDGIYTCQSCDPALTVPADGREHAVSGHAYYDAALVRVLGATSLEVMVLRGGREFGREMLTIAADGQTYTSRYTSHNGAQVTTGEYIARRVAPGPAGAHAISGSWQVTQLGAGELQRTVQYRLERDHFAMRWNGQSYDARLDGGEVPQRGDPAHTTVSVKRIDANTILETDHRQGKVVDEVRLALAPDGRTIKVEDHDLAHGQATSFVLEKQ